MPENDALIDRVIAVTSELTGVIERENAILEARRPCEVAALQTEKGRLTALYAAEIATLKRHGNALKTAAPQLRQRLKAAAERFQAAMAAHVRLVSTMRTVTENVLKAISDEVSRRNNPVQTYGGNASFRKAPAAVPTSLALNRTI